MKPKEIKVVNNKHLLIKWFDNNESKIKLANLRINCPCALCAAEREERGASYIPIYSDEQLTINEIHIIGNYAIGIVWKDAHDTGIYDFNYLKKLSTQSV